MNSLLIANAFSFISACFTIASSWTKNPHRTYWYQVGQCLVYAGAAYFFGVYANVPVMLISAFRNGLVASEKYTKVWMFICSAASLIVGLVINHGSGNIPGYIAIFSTVFYTISSYFLKDAIAVKINVAIDLGLWLISDIMLTDVPSGIVDLVSTVLALITIVRILHDRSKEAQMIPEQKQSE